MADLQAEVLQLGLGFDLGFGTHPVQCIQACAHRQLHVGDQLIHFGLCVRRKIQLHVVAANRLAHGRIGQGDTALPAFALFGLAGQELRTELELRIGEVARQQRGGGIDGAERLPGLQRGEVGVGIDRGDLRDRRVLADHCARGLVNTRALEEGSPRKARCRALERRQFQRIVGLVAVAAFGAGPVCFGDAGFHGQDGLGIGFCLRPAGQLQHLADIGLVALALRGEVFAQVHFAVTQAQP